MYGITNPPLETGHNWRQVTGLMVARNFFEVDANIFEPRVDLEGGEKRVIGMEFPLLNYLHHLFSLLFGYEHWYGRLINLLVTSVGIYSFSEILKSLFSKKLALYSTLALLSSIYFAYSRKMMPDTFSLGLGMIAIHFVLQYFKEGKTGSLALYLLFSSLAILAKLPSILILSPIVLLLFKDQEQHDKKLRLAIWSTFPLLIGGIWYYWWNPRLEEIYGSWYNQGMRIRDGVLEISTHLADVWQNFSFHSFYSYAYFILFLAGVVLMIRQKEKKLIYISSVYALFSLIYIFKAGFYFHHHNYYIIPIVPMMAVIIGYGLTKIKNSVLLALVLVAATAESIANQQHDLRIKEKMEYKLTLASIINEQIPQKEKLIIVSEGNPQLLYLAHRKGWVRSEEAAKDPTLIDQLVEDGANYILIDKHESELELNYPMEFQNQDFLLYSLSSLK